MVALLPGNQQPPAKPIPPPKTGTPHRVADGEDWASIAKFHKVPAREIVVHNCGVDSTPKEINWYLEKRVGCNVTHDRRNWAFSKSASPGILYIPTAGTVPHSAQYPTIKTLYGGPKDLGCGGIEWLVEFRLPQKAPNDGWIIQQIDRSYDIRRKNGTVADANLNAKKATFWEAWPVKKGAVLTATRLSSTSDGRTYDDMFDQPKRPALQGTFKIFGLVKFFEVTLPADFIKNNPKTRAFSLHSTDIRPPFWDDTGTMHNLSTSWDCTGNPNPASPQISWDVQEKRK